MFLKDDYKLSYSWTASVSERCSTSHLISLNKCFPVRLRSRLLVSGCP